MVKRSLTGTIEKHFHTLRYGVRQGVEVVVDRMLAGSLVALTVQEVLRESDLDGPSGSSL
jgi:hypothetical protein